MTRWIVARLPLMMGSFARLGAWTLDLLSNGETLAPLVHGRVAREVARDGDRRVWRCRADRGGEG